MTDIIHKGSKYTDEQRRQACLEFLITGSMKTVSKRMGIPRRTLDGWKQASWWDGLLTELRHEKEAEIQAQLSKIIVKAHDETVDRLEHGDEIHTAAGIKRIKMRGLDTATVAAIAYDKLRLSLNQPTTIRGNSSDIEALAQQFRQIARNHENIQNSVVAVQDESEDGD